MHWWDWAAIAFLAVILIVIISNVIAFLISGGKGPGT